MRTPVFLILPIILHAFVFAIAQGENEAPGIDVWAVVNGQQISRADVERAYKSRAGKAEPLSEDSKLEALSEVIDTEILVQQSKALGLQATDGETEDGLKEIKAGYTEEQFQNRLASQGISAEGLKLEVGRQISVTKVLDKEVISRVAITDEDIAAFYEQNRSRFAGELTDPRVMISVREALWDRTVQPLVTSYVARLRSQAKISNYVARPQ